MKIDVVKHLTEVLGLEQEDLPEFLTSFMDSFEDCVRQLDTLADGSDFAGIRRVTHTLFGFSQNVGATDLYEASVALNTSAKALDQAACAQGIIAIKNLFSSYSAEICR